MLLIGKIDKSFVFCVARNFIPLCVRLYSFAIRVVI